MKRYVKDNNTYQIFNVDAPKHEVHFLWGKFDFKVSFKHTDEATAKAKAGKQLSWQDSNGQHWLIDTLQLLFKRQWYQYERVTEHGFTFEETKWSLDGQTHFAELPRDLLQIAGAVGAEELGFQPMVAATT